MIKPKSEAASPALGLQERRAFMRLPVEERRRQMSEQAARMLAQYQAPREAASREKWQGGDVVEVNE